MASFILASASPRRVALLQAAGFDFQIEVPPVEESRSDCFTAGELTLLNALRKAAAVADRNREEFVLAADTLVALDTEVFGKPADFADAKRILKRLVGKSHEVSTSVALVRANSRQIVCRVSRTQVKFRALSDEQVDAYLRIAEPLDKAGAYSAQTSPELIIEKVTGSFSNVVGLPMDVVVPLLASHGIHPRVTS